MVRGAASNKRTAGKRGQGSIPQKRAKKKNDYDDAGDAFFLNDEDDKQRKGGAEEEDEEEEVQETADELRLRLAREYLTKLQDEDDGVDDRRGVTGGSDDEEDEDLGEDEDDDDAGMMPGRSLDAAARAQRLAERLQNDVALAQGRLQRRLAHRVRIPAPAAAAGNEQPSSSSYHRGHKLSATALALTSDDRTAYTVSKDGGIVRWDIETMKRTQLFRPGDGPSSSSRPPASASASAEPLTTTADWVARKARTASRSGLVAAAVSSDGRYLAVGGGDARVHVLDAGSGAYVQGFPGHKDMVTGLAFREGTHTLMSCSADRTVKLWSLADRAYIDTLYGHQAEVLAVDASRAERVLTAGHDHTARLWKIPEETQLIFRAHDRAMDCIRFVTSNEWITGGCDGSVHLWAATKKKPVWVARGAHGPNAAAVYGSPAAPPAGAAAAAPPALAPEHGWVTSVAVCRSSDLAASGAGDGSIRLWAVKPSKAGGAGSLECIGALPQPGFVNGLAIARSARFVVAAVGQEPRMGRWARDGRARNGLALHRLSLED